MDVRRRRPEGYLLEYRVFGDGSWPTLTPAPSSSATSYTHSGLTAGTTYDYRLSATNTYGSSGTIPASDMTGTPLQACRVSNCLALDGPAASANTADPYGDGLNNLFEYALDRAPLTPKSSTPTTASVVGTGKLQITFLRALPASEHTYSVQASRNLVNWTGLAVNPGTVGQNVTVTDAPLRCHQTFLATKTAASLCNPRSDLIAQAK